jgi:hypothetical protein
VGPRAIASGDIGAENRGDGGPRVNPNIAGFVAVRAGRRLRPGHPIDRPRTDWTFWAYLAAEIGVGASAASQIGRARGQVPRTFMPAAS